MAQRKGIDGLLLKPVMRRAASQKREVYLKTAEMRDVGFYQKNGLG